MASDVVTADLTQPSLDVNEGDILDGRYRIERKLGGGGMGVVWAAQHILLNTRVAIKFPQPEILQNPDAVRRFIREARAAANIKSEHVARVLDVVILDDGYPFQVIEFLEGGDLRGWLKQKGPLGITQAVDFMLQIAAAIAAAHAIGVVHRDLKPENLFHTLGNDGHACIKVLDFGISKLLHTSALSDGGHDTGVTHAGTVLGSPFYMSPEHLQSARDVDARTDIWSLGVILFELLTGRLPFEGDALTELCINIAIRPAPSIRSLRPDVSPELEAVIEKCLAKQREQRYQDVASFAEALRPFASAASGQRIERAAPLANDENDSLATLLPSVAAEQQVLRKSAPTVGTWENSAPMRPSWTRMLPSSIAVLAGLGLVALLGFWILHTHADKPQSATAPSGSAAAEPAREQASSAPGLVPENAALASEGSAAAPRAADAGAPASEPILILQGSPASVARVVQPAKRASVATRRQVNCNPNYDLDAEGQKHYKPECF